MPFYMSFPRKMLEEVLNKVKIKKKKRNKRKTQDPRDKEFNSGE